MIRVKRPPVPADLKGPGSKGEQELTAVKAAFRTVAGRKKGFDFKAYKSKSIGPALQAAFHGKCAYCEGTYDDVHPVDIEHFRPKAGYVQNGSLKTPGYWWLAMAWSNLLPCCIDCNRARTQEFQNAPPHVSGKANQFPIKDEARRARKPGEEKREGRLLLDPCADRPEGHLVFDDDGHVDPATNGRGRLSEKGIASIEVYGLERDAKVRARKRVLRYLATAMKRVEELAELVEESRGDPRWEQRLADARRELEQFAAPEQEFAGMCRQAIDRFERRLIG